MLFYDLNGIYGRPFTLTCPYVSFDCYTDKAGAGPLVLIATLMTFTFTLLV